MFIDNKYYTWYTNIIERRRRIVPDGYTERHHIVPKCLGGNNKASNLVQLTAREHYLCHWLLTKCVKGNGKYKVYEAMTMFNNNHNRKLRMTSHRYEAIRKSNSIASSYRNQENQHWKKRSPDTAKDKKRKSEFAKSCRWMNNGSKETFTNECEYYLSIGYEYGRLPFSSTTISNMKSASAYRIGKSLSEVTKQKLREAHLGKTFTKEHRENLGKVRRKWQVTIDGVEIGLKEAAQKHGIHTDTVYWRCNSSNYPNWIRTKING